jgi:uncharacterized membrane protein
MLALVLVACGGTAPPPASTSAPLSVWQRTCPHDSTVTWDNFGSALMHTYCTVCHSSDLPPDQRQLAPEDVNLDTVGGVRRNIEKVWLDAADGHVLMPPVGGPSMADRERLGEWLACGAP